MIMIIIRLNEVGYWWIFTKPQIGKVNVHISHRTSGWPAPIDHFICDNWQKKILDTKSKTMLESE